MFTEISPKVPIFYLLSFIEQFMMMCPPQDPLHKVEIQFPVGDQTVSDLFHQKLQESELVIHCMQCAHERSYGSLISVIY